MTAIRSSRLLWALVPVLAVLATLALMRSERPSDQRVELPFDFRQTAGTSTDTLISSLQEKIRENPKDLLDEARKLEDQSPESFATRWSLALARHDFAAALRHGTRALALDPKNATYYGVVGDAQIELGMYDEAIHSYQEMVDRRPNFDSFSRV